MASSSSSKVPPWKLIPGCGFAVDAFRHSAAEPITAFFLSHAHSDHYTGLSERWDAGPIYCSPITGRLLHHLVGVRTEFIHPLPLDQPCTIQGVEVTLVDANHCPGAVQLLFRLQDGRRYVHCGDMRFDNSMLVHPQLACFQGCDAVFLDTTYCNPKHCFPSQEDSIRLVVDAISGYLREEETNGRSHLFVISTYTIGKERILTAVAENCGRRIECSERKMATLRCVGMSEEELQHCFTTETGSSQVVLAKWGILGETWPFFRPNWTALEALREERGADKVVGFLPTGWVHKPNQTEFPVYDKGDKLRIHLVPYSEHSSFEELQTYVGFLRPKKVVPTVGMGGDNGEKNRVKMLEHFRNLVDQTSSKANFLRSMRKDAVKRDNAEVKVERPSHGPSITTVNVNGDGISDVDGAWCNKGEDDTGGGYAMTPLNVGGDVDKPMEERQGRSRVEEVDRLAGGDSVQLQSPHIEPPTARPAAVVESDDDLEHLKAVLGDALDGAAAARLLKLAGGDLQRAVNMHYDGLAVRGMGSSHSGEDLHGTPSGGTKRSSGTPATVTPAAKKVDRGRRGSGVGSASGDIKQKSITAFLKGKVGKSEGDGKGSGAIAMGCATKADDVGSQQVAEAVGVGSGDTEGGGAIFIPLLTPIQLTASQGGSTQGASKPAAAVVSGVQDVPAALGSTAPQSTRPSAFPADLSITARRDAGGDGGCRDDPADRPADYVNMEPSKYNPQEHACWAEGQATPYLHLARTFAAVSSTHKRIATRDAFVNCFHAIMRLSPGDLLPAAYLACGKLAPDHEGVELSVGESTVARAVREATGTSRDRLRDMYRELGDLGDVAQNCRRNQVTLMRPAPLTVCGVYSSMRKIAAEKGAGAAARRQSVVLGFLRSAREEETRFVVRTLVQNLRVGANWRSILSALGRAAAIFHFRTDGNDNVPSKADLESADAATVEAFHVCPSLDVLVPALLNGPPSALERVCMLQPGLPIKPMLAKPAEGIAEALRLGLSASGGGAAGSAGSRPDKSSALLAEYKYDGQRAQIHVNHNREVSIFSRNGENKTGAFPDVVALILEATAGGASTLIVDAEIVAVDREDGNRLRAFQELSTRARGDVDSADVKVDVAVFVFDLLLLDGESMLRKTLRERRAGLTSALPRLSSGRVEMARSMEVVTTQTPEEGGPSAAGASQHVGDTHRDITTAEGSTTTTITSSVEAQLQDFLMESFAAGAEGLMVKQLDTCGYQPSKRSESWLKVKRDYCENLRDSLDLVPIGAWHGNGRKAGWLSPFLLAAWDPEAEEFQSVCRVMSGFTDQFYAEATARLSRIDAPKPYYVTGERCSVWFEPTEVWEIRGADLTISPVHKAARGHIHPEKGVSMRFPRFIRIRDDKSVADASGPDVIVELFNRQTRKVVFEPEAGDRRRGQPSGAVEQDGGDDIASDEEPGSDAGDAGGDGDHGAVGLVEAGRRLPGAADDI